MSKEDTPRDAQFDVLALYREVERLTGNMLNAAHRADWDRLVELEAGCASCVQALQGCGVPEQLSADRPIRFGTSFSMRPISRRMSRVYGCSVALAIANIGRFFSSTICMRKPSLVISSSSCFLNCFSNGLASIAASIFFFNASSCCFSRFSISF